MGAPGDQVAKRDPGPSVSHGGDGVFLLLREPPLALRACVCVSERERGRESMCLLERESMCVRVCVLECVS